MEVKNLKPCDEMDLVAFAVHDIDHISRLPADEVIVYNPDMSKVEGMEQHGKDMGQVLTAFPHMKKSLSATRLLAQWNDGQIAEEYLFYDNVDSMTRLGMMNDKH